MPRDLAPLLGVPDFDKDLDIDTDDSESGSLRSTAAVPGLGAIEFATVDIVAGGGGTGWLACMISDGDGAISFGDAAGSGNDRCTTEGTGCTDGVRSGVGGDGALSAGGRGGKVGDGDFASVKAGGLLVARLLSIAVRFPTKPEGVSGELGGDISSSCPFPVAEDDVFHSGMMAPCH